MPCCPAFNRLTALKVDLTKKPGWYADGNGLYLQVSNTGTKSWVYRYKTSGKERRCGLGGISSLSLLKARNAAKDCRELRTKGIDPIDKKRQIKAENALKEANGVTFKECALSYIESHKAGWKSRKHESQWRNTLETYAYPFIGKLSVQDVDVGHVMKVLEPIWYKKTETATRVRQRIENVLDYAKVRKYRTGENPALWRGHLDKLLPKRSKVQKVKHFDAMPYSDVPAYFKALRKKDTLAAKALAFTILTATRSNEAREARWNEFDLKAGIWSIPDERMKADKPHRVPLSDEALMILKETEPFKVDDRVFPGLSKGRSISDAAVLKQLKSSHPNCTVHGFRSSFRDWCAETTNYPREIAESALAHAIKSETEAAYQRGDMFIKRQKLMDAWTNHCLKGKKVANVTPIQKHA